MFNPQITIWSLHSHKGDILPMFFSDIFPLRMSSYTLIKTHFLQNKFNLPIGQHLNTVTIFILVVLLWFSNFILTYSVNKTNLGKTSTLKGSEWVLVQPYYFVTISCVKARTLIFVALVTSSVKWTSFWNWDSSSNIGLRLKAGPSV